MKKLLTGNEAVARGAYEAGVRFASAYPGTPSTEIMENLAGYDEIMTEWAPNEKVALEAVMGASMAGARSMASMKHVGVNVAADPLFTFAYTGVNGGMVLVTADEPGQHSSQNEQDNRNYAKFAKIPMLEPSDSQESKDMLKTAFEISEKFDTPVLFRMTTRICHSKGIVDCEDRTDIEIKDYVKDINKYITVPAIARKLRVKVEERTKKLLDYSNATPLNSIEWNSADIGIVASGAAYCYAREVFKDSASYLKLGFTYPLATKKLTEFCEKVKKVYVIEENDPYIEEAIKVLGFNCIGKDVLPSYGELTPDVIRKAIFGKTNPTLTADPDKIVPRPPSLCAGCPHRGFFYEVGRRKNLVVSGDIGCYSLAFAEPFNAVDCNICMGSSISMGHGAQKVFNMKDGNKTRVISVLGDSTFFHTGINSLLDVAYNNSNTINVILDNRITGMTGHQENPGSGYTIKGKETNDIDIEQIVKAFGLKNVAVINPNDISLVKSTIDWALSLDEPSVIITRWPCVLKRFSPQDKREFPNAFKNSCKIDEEKCIGCKICIRAGCPALSFDNDIKKAKIDPSQCVGCEVCAQLCNKSAIVKEDK